jgi:hemolysin activation/secretion protein
VLPPLSPPEQDDRLSRGPRFVLRGVRFAGNTALADAVLEEVATPFVGRLVTRADLEELRRRLTLAYVERGFITSGALLPDQQVTDGTVTYRLVEGVVSDIEVAGTSALDRDYVQYRLERATHPPLNIGEVEQRVQILLQDPNIERLNVEIVPGAQLGEAQLHAAVTEASRYSLSAGIANDQSPSIGSVHGQLGGVVRNLIGWGDALAVRYGRSEGLDDGGLAWAVPVTAADTLLSARFDISNAAVVDAAFSGLDITSQTKTIGVGIAQPVYRTPRQNLTLGVSLDWRDGQTFLLGEPFSFTSGVDNGRARAAILRVSQDWLDRTDDQVIAARSTFNIGLPILGATVTDQAPTGEFLSWLGQFQYVRRVIGDTQVIARADVQLARDPLFSFEQIAIGGGHTVRGFRENELVRDNGVIGSLEGRVPLFQLPLPRIGEPLDGMVQLAPFFDFGRGWNTGRASPRPSDIASVGLGLRWEVSSLLSAQLYYGYALREIVHSDHDLQVSGIHFNVTMKLY